MRMRAWGLVVVGLLAAGPALADWRFDFRSGPEPRYERYYRHGGPPFGNGRFSRYVEPWGPPRVVQRCVVELVPGPWGYSEVTRCRPAGPPPTVYRFRID